MASRVIRSVAGRSRETGRARIVHQRARLAWPHTMTSANTTLRELVAHLARAQRAFDAGRVEEAEGAIRDALAIDPHNVQAADLRQRLAKTRAAAASAQTGPAGAAVATGRRPAPSAASPGRVPPDGWSTFEQRVRARRADHAVEEARNALAGRDPDGARAALAELDEVSPGDARRAPIVASLGGAAARATAAPAKPAATRRITATTVSPVVTWRPISSDPSPSPDIGGIALDRVSLHADPMPLERVIAGTAITAQPRPSPVVAPKQSRARAAVAMGAVAASALLGFWLFATRPQDSLWTIAQGQASPAVSEAPAAPARDTTAWDVGPGQTVPPLLEPFEEPLAGDEAVGTLGEPVDDPPPTDTAQSAATAPAPASVDMGESSRTAVASSRSTLNSRVSEPGTSFMRPADRVANTAPAEPPPAPLEAPVQSAIIAPDTRRTVDPRGDGLAVGAVTPVPGPPPAAVASPPAPVATRGTRVEASEVRSVLDGYADAFSTLDANATQRVWPGADVRGLTRAFDQLTAQTITFNRCDVNASGETADAVCVGRATWVPKVGDRSPRSEQRTWRFALGRDGDDWVIDRVQVQR
jgi:hypothetical protein